MNDLFMYKIESLREEFGKPMRVSSAYRDPVRHPAESRKTVPGYHAQGRALDILVSGNDAWRLVALAMDYELSVGISQKGPHEHRFIHLDDRPEPIIWSY
jgi:uncharacterized protein YcbK (DUF882 family)